MSGLWRAQVLGFGPRSGQRARAHVVHAVPAEAKHTGKGVAAACGARPGPRGYGWQEPPDGETEVTCIDCVVVLNTIMLNLAALGATTGEGGGK